MSGKIRFVIIGTGNIANAYISAVENIRNAETVAFVSRTKKYLSQVTDSSKYEIAAELTDIKSEYEAVIICTPNGLHHISALEAARLGKHVLCEKPLDITIESTSSMIAACRSAKVKLAVAYQRRYSSDNPVIKKMLLEGKLGKVYSVDLSVKNYRDESYYSNAPYRGTYSIDGGGPFIQQAVHYIDLYAWYFGIPEKITSHLSKLHHNIEAEDYGIAICSHSNGMIGNIIASSAIKPGFPARMEIHTSKGTVIMENDIITLWSIEGIENPTQKSSLAQKHTGASNPFVNDTANHELIISDFIDSIKEDREPLINGESGEMATRIVLDIYRNNQTPF